MAIVFNRVATASQQTEAVGAIAAQRAAIAKTQRELSTGKKEFTDSASVLSVRALERFISDGERYALSADVLEYRLNLAELSLTSGINTLQRARELTVYANNASVTEDARKVTADEVDSLLDEILRLANSRDAFGEHIFSGSQVNTPPFVQQGGDIVYQGDAVTRSVRISDSRLVRDGFAGDQLFVDVPQGNGVFTVEPAEANTGSARIGRQTVLDRTAWEAGNYTLSFIEPSSTETVSNDESPGTTLRYEIRANDADPDAEPLAAGVYVSGDQIEFNGVQFSISGAPAITDQFSIGPAGTESIFTTLKHLSATLRSPLATPAQTARVGEVLQSVLQQLDGSINSLSDARSTTGSRLLTLQQINEFRTEQMDIARDSLAKISDVDFAEAIARLNQQITALQVAQQSYGKTNTATLFDYL
jgi:flagellar hook-associated protein 3 FlgL